METWEKPRVSSSRDHYRQPSFSSTLLDQIYRSIDDSPPLESTTRRKKHHNNISLHEERDHTPDKILFHRRSIAAESRRTTTSSSVFLRYSNSTSSDSSGFSSSELDSFYLRSSSKSSPPKPIRTSEPSSKQELGGFLRTKSKALKIYTDLKKVKQPLSPGGRLATFLNSLFTNAATNHKKLKKINTTVSSPSHPPPPHSSSNTTCSSTSSFSRSCLSKTPSSSGKSKRSVRFCPVNVILDEDSSIHIPYGYSNYKLHGNNNDRHVMDEENRRVIEAAKDLIRTYQMNKAVTTCDNVLEGDDDEDDDAASYASSDLFELEIERYGEELPVYETTRLDNTNRAIATSLIV